MEGSGSATLMSSVTTALSTVLEWFGTIISELLAADGALNPLWPLLAIGIAITLVFVGVKVVRSFTWGA